ncbi:NmrA family NAD(P)-binding protein [Allorhizocola rhizosphaerae]|uniref:NmrA family NAD(P)-binding protein n=1 Tax=Allorhizocola rhizosphaerae TaxID=1872709 RepID=UPI000E3D6624|nr:NmrA family NAD(P)-binding protein [Allorhizocola rhizosphaerae]
MILVLGASGTTGRRVAHQLRSGGHFVRPASRHGDVHFDWSEPGSWQSAVAGSKRMYLMAPDGVAVDPAFVKSAVQWGVRRIVLLSSRSIETMGDERLMAAEQTVRAADAEWTIVRATWFNQNFDEGFLREAVLGGEVALPLGNARYAFVDAEDVATVAATALIGDEHAGETYEVTGPYALSFAEALEIISRASGRTIRFLGGDDDYVKAQGRPREQMLGELQAFRALREQGDEVPTDAVEGVTARPPRRFEDYARAVWA